jgi:hypothetical protein
MPRPISGALAASEREKARFRGTQPYARSRHAIGFLRRSACLVPCYDRAERGPAHGVLSALENPMSIPASPAVSP